MGRPVGGAATGNLRDLPAPDFTYRFHPIEVCNMCGAPVAAAVVLGRRLNGPQGIRPTRRVGIATTVLRCGACGLVFSSPMPVPLDIAQHYGTPPEEYWKSDYFDPNESYFDGQIERFLNLWRGSGTPRAFDVGAGVGKAMASMGRRGFDVHGLEPSEPFYRRALDDTGIDPARLQLATVEEAEPPAEEMDFVTFGAVLEHLYDPGWALERTLGWLAPGGLIHAEVPSARWLTGRLANLAYRLQGLDYVGNLSPMHVPYHLYEFTAESFRLHAEQRGHRLVDHRILLGSSFLPRPVDAIARRVMRATATGLQLEVWLGRDPAG